MVNALFVIGLDLEGGMLGMFCYFRSPLPGPPHQGEGINGHPSLALPIEGRGLTVTPPWPSPSRGGD